MNAILIPLIFPSLKDVDTRSPYTIAIGKQAEVRLRDGYPVTLDCHVLAEASFGCDYNRSSIMWFQSESIIEDNSTIRGISISSDRQRLLISTLSISSGAEQIGTEAVYTCKVCGKAWGKSGSLPDCKKFKTQVKAKSKILRSIIIIRHAHYHTPYS